MYDGWHLAHVIQAGRHARYYFPPGIKRGKGKSVRKDFFDSVRQVGGGTGGGAGGAGGGGVGVLVLVSVVLVWVMLAVVAVAVMVVAYRLWPQLR